MRLQSIALHAMSVLVMLGAVLVASLPQGLSAQTHDYDGVPDYPRSRIDEPTRALGSQAARDAAPEPYPIDLRRRSETYVGGLFGYTLPYDLKDVSGRGSLSGASFNDLDLQHSVVYGAKVGHFFSDHLNWLGLELEAFNTTPHIKQQALTSGGTVSAGTSLWVTTVALNVIARANLACELTVSGWYANPVNRYGERRYAEFCPLQPYIGVGLGVFFAWASDGQSQSLAVPGLNALAGVRYFVTRDIALFGEYKYNRAALGFDNIEGSRAGFEGTYSASHFVGGISFHFH